MRKDSKYYFHLTMVVLFTLIAFAALTIPHLQHGFAFIFPVPLAVFIIKYRIKDGILPAIILMIFAPIITHFLPVGGGSWVRGVFMMLTAVTIGFLHGSLSKIKMSHLREILIVMATEIFLGALTTLVFYFMKDPVFAFNIEFPHYFERILTLFSLNHNSIYAQNAGVIFANSVIPYVISLAITEVLLTHILIHLVLKYVFELVDNRPFSGLYFRLPKVTAYVFLGGLLLALISLFFLGNPLDEGLLTAIVILFILVLSVMIIFILQGILLMIFLFRARRQRELSLLIFVVGLVLSVPFAILGALSVIFGWGDSLLSDCKGGDC